MFNIFHSVVDLSYRKTAFVLLKFLCFNKFQLKNHNLKVSCLGQWCVLQHEYFGWKFSPIK